MAEDCVEKAEDEDISDALKEKEKVPPFFIVFLHKINVLYMFLQSLIMVPL